MKIAFFEIENWEKNYLAEKFSDHELVFFEKKLTKDNLPEEKNFEIASVFISSEIEEEVLGVFSDLKLIATRSTGFDHINLESCRSKNIAVANVPTYGENTVAEHTFALILNLSRKIFPSYDRIKETGSFSLEGLRGFDLKGKILGVIGTGHIGQHVIRMAKGFEMDVIAFDAYPNQALAETFSFRYVLNLDELLSRADIITVHVPLLPQTKYLINKTNIYKIKKGAYLINTARGEIVETDAMIKALKDGHLGGAGLDVLEEESGIKEEIELLTSDKSETHNLKTIIQNHILIDMPNVVITPHNAFNSEEALKRILDTTIENIKSFIAGTPINIVNPKA